MEPTEDYKNYYTPRRSRAGWRESDAPPQDWGRKGAGGGQGGGRRGELLPAKFIIHHMCKPGLTAGDSCAHMVQSMLSGNYQGVEMISSLMSH